MHADGLCTEDGAGAQVSEPSRDAQARRNVRGDQHWSETKRDYVPLIPSSCRHQPADRGQH